MFMFGGSEHLNATPKETIALLFFPIGLVVGFGIAWWKPLVGSIFSIVSLSIFYGWMYVASGGFPGGPYFALFALPAALFLVDGMLQRKQQHVS